MLVDATGALPVLPDLPADHDGHALADVLALVGADIPLAPTAKLADGGFVHLVGMRGGAPEGALVAPDALADPAHAAVVAPALAELDPRRSPVLRPDWFRPGWFDLVEAWIDAVLAPSGRRRTGPVEPFRLWSISAVVRVPTDGGELWCKASCDHFRREASIHAAVERLLPDLVPRLVAIERDEGWLLMEPMDGTEQDEQPAGTAAEVAQRWAAAQLEAIEHVPALLAAGLEHRGADATIAAFLRLLATSAELELLTDAELADVRAAADRAVALTRACWEAGIPETLAHGDLHLGNVAWDGRALRIFDWTDGCVSHPFLDATHLTRFADDASASAAKAVYAAVWRDALPSVDVDRALRLAPLADLVFQTVTFEAIAAATEQQSAWELGGVVARNLRLLPGLVVEVG
ncbi:aminoglycoside phosphotransferase family protein [Agrococcus jenensis]|uniref:Phosphotransferase family enzyme n=1 Tax=Agrococcus jenensis TaxID=46353 RepID=A0A3N2AR30_9MICO|nr:aminoglycoside phosphotransferase family protein [Agrococcus jenensis]ROR65500.1 phosphotransferase family enzyme [Agrococcus jenensis]